MPYSAAQVLMEPTTTQLKTVLLRLIRRILPFQSVFMVMQLMEVSFRLQYLLFQDKTPITRSSAIQLRIATGVFTWQVSTMCFHLQCMIRITRSVLRDLEIQLPITEEARQPVLVSARSSRTT